MSLWDTDKGCVPLMQMVEPHFQMINLMLKGRGGSPDTPVPLVPCLYSHCFVAVGLAMEWRMSKRILELLVYVKLFLFLKEIIIYLEWPWRGWMTFRKDFGTYKLWNLEVVFCKLTQSSWAGSGSLSFEFSPWQFLSSLSLLAPPLCPALSCVPSLSLLIPFFYSLPDITS